MKQKTISLRIFFFVLFIIFEVKFLLSYGSETKIELDKGRSCFRDTSQIVGDLGVLTSIKKGHKVFSIMSDENLMNPEIVRKIKEQIELRVIKTLNFDEHPTGFIDFMFTGFDQSRNLSTRFNIRKLEETIDRDLYLKMGRYIVPRFLLGKLKVPKAELAQNLTLFVRYYFQKESENTTTWHQDGCYSHIKEKGCEKRRVLTIEAWTFGHFFDEEGTLFKEIPNMKLDFNLSIVFNGDEEHRAPNKLNRMVVLGGYYDIAEWDEIFLKKIRNE